MPLPTSVNEQDSAAIIAALQLSASSQAVPASQSVSVPFPVSSAVNASPSVVVSLSSASQPSLVATNSSSASTSQVPARPQEKESLEVTFAL